MHIYDKLCGNCHRQNEVDLYTNAIEEGLNENNDSELAGFRDTLVKLVIEYVVGYGIICSSGRDCYNDVLISNKLCFYNESGWTSDKKFLFHKSDTDEYAERIYDTMGFVTC